MVVTLGWASAAQVMRFDADAIGVVGIGAASAGSHSDSRETLSSIFV